ncbi:MAG: putative maltokinase, partial [Limnobacter sp.]|nr:putative maltokinase [Limnobacter sp.]
LGDRDAVRTPMQWSPDRNAGFSRADPQRLYLPPIMDPIYGYQAINVEAQARDPSSLLNWTRRLLAVRQSSRAFGRGSLSFLTPGNRKILAYLREYTDETAIAASGGDPRDAADEHEETILCVANLSRAAQPVELNLSRFRGRVPVEMMGRTAFPPIGDLPYLLTLPAHGFYWFRLARDVEVPPWHEEHLVREDLPLVVLFGGWSSLFPERVQPWRASLAEKNREKFERQILARYLEQQRWFAARAEPLERVSLVDWLVFERPGRSWLIAIVSADFAPAGRDAPAPAPARYFLPLSLVWGDVDEPQVRALGANVLAKVRQQAELGVIADAIADEAFCRMIVEALGQGRRVEMGNGSLVFEPTDSFAEIAGDEVETLELQRGAGQSSNAVAILGERLFIKGYRALQPGINPEVELGRHLTDVARFPYCVPVAGSVAYVSADGTPTTLAIVQKYVPHQGDGWTWAVEYLERFLEDSIADETIEDPHAAFLELIATLGTRVGELHLAFALSSGNPDFDPQPADPAQQQQWLQRVREETIDSLGMLGARLGELPTEARTPAEAVLASRAELVAIIDAQRPLPGVASARHHGDLHLGQVLLANNDFLIIDFEGEPSRPIAERRARHTPLRDVAGMLRSFDYVRWTALRGAIAGGGDARRLAPLAARWLAEVRTAFLDAYASATAGAPLFPSLSAVSGLLGVLELEKAMYELRYEIHHRPAWADIPLNGILDFSRPEWSA